LRVTGDMPPVRAGDELRGLVGRLLGWTCERTIDAAMESIDLAAGHLAELVLCGAGDLVPIARALHRRTLGGDRPFVTCDPRRVDASASVRSPANRVSGVAAFEAALGGTLCLRTRRLPQDIGALIARLRRCRDVMLVVCVSDIADVSPLLIRPAPLALPPLATRRADIDRIIAEYAADAIAELAAPSIGFSEDDHAWVREHAAGSLEEIEKATLRLTAIRTSDTVTKAAAQLGMAVPSLLKWIDRRRQPSRRSTTEQAASA
jgi:hypothetical protein